MTLGRAPDQADLLRSTVSFCNGRLSPTSIYGLLFRECHNLFPDDGFADLYEDIGRNSVPPRIVAVVMVLQRLEGLSDREAVDRFTFDARWKYAAGGLDFEHEGFVHTVLVDMRARLRNSERPDRIFDRVLEVAKKAGMVGRRRVLDSTPLYDAVATQDTVTMIRSALRGLLRVAGESLAPELRGVLKRDDDYAAAGKPVCDWDDKAAREALVDALARDAYAVIALLDGRPLSPEVTEAAALVATVVGQDLEKTEDGCFRIAKRVAKDRVISTVDPEARHGHKTAARGFDGYKGHIAIDPDTEIITAAETTAGNVSDGSVAKELIADLVPLAPKAPESNAEPMVGTPTDAPTAPVAVPVDAAAPSITPVEVLGDASYGTAEFLMHLESAGAVANVKVQAPAAPDGRFTKDSFKIDLVNDTVTCPAGRLVQIRRSKDGSGQASFGTGCTTCPMASSCTASKSGRNIQIHPHEAVLHRARTRQKSPEWRRDYKATRPKVERKLAHLMRRRHGGRRARMRGRERVAQDFTMLCAAVNLQRLARFQLGSVDAHVTPVAA
jgi:Transposase DDE domain/Transposase domain (DUF772)